jgi:hypothetical protein
VGDKYRARTRPDCRDDAALSSFIQLYPLKLASSGAAEIGLKGEEMSE